MVGWQHHAGGEPLPRRAKEAILADNIDFFKMQNHTAIRELAVIKIPELCLSKFRVVNYSIFEYMEKEGKINMLAQLEDDLNWQQYIDEFRGTYELKELGEAYNNTELALRKTVAIK